MNGMIPSTALSVGQVVVAFVSNVGVLRLDPLALVRLTKAICINLPGIVEEQVGKLFVFRVLGMGESIELIVLKLRTSG